MSEQYQRLRDAVPSVCLDPTELESYCRSRQNTETIRRVELHLADCEACRLRLAAHVRQCVLKEWAGKA